MQVEYKIREYQEQDLDALLSTWENATRVAHPFMTEAFIKESGIEIAKIYLPMSKTWVVTTDKGTIGFISLIGNEVGGLFVQPKYHRHGLGKMLMDKALETHQKLEVEVFKENPIGRAFYEKYGFKFLEEAFHEPTKQKTLRLGFTVKSH